MTDTTAAAAAAPNAGGENVPGTGQPTIGVSPAAGTVPADTISYDGFSDELKGYAQNKGWKNWQETAEGYRQLESLRGVPEDRLLKLPEKLDDAEAMKPVWKRLGVPEKAEEYQLEVPEGQDKSFAEWAKGLFHKHNVPRAAAEAMVKEWNAKVMGEGEEATKAMAAERATAEATLKEAWGQAYDKKLAVIDGAAEKLGMDQKQLLALREAMGPVAAMKFMNNIAERLGEDNFVSSDKAASFNGVMSPEQAQAEIAGLKKDTDFVKRYTAGDSEAKAKWNRLHQLAYPGMI